MRFPSRDAKPTLTNRWARSIRVPEYNCVKPRVKTQHFGLPMIETSNN